jgi:molybdate/tungstate transport system permease protein
MDSFVKAVVGLTASVLLLLLVALPLLYVDPPPPGFVESFVLTAVFGLAASLLSLVPGLAAAVAARRGGAWRALTQVLYIPAVVPPTSVGVLLASFSLPRLFCEEGVATLCALASFVSEYVINRPLGVLIAMAVMALPTSFSIFDGALREERAEAFFRALGFSGLRLLFLLLLSLRSATASALVFSWIRSFGELGVLLIFASYPVTASIYIYQAWLSYGVGPAVGASLAVIAAVAALAFVARRWLS